MEDYPLEKALESVKNLIDDPETKQLMIDAYYDRRLISKIIRQVLVIDLMIGEEVNPDNDLISKMIYDAVEESLEKKKEEIDYAEDVSKVQIRIKFYINKEKEE